MHATDEDLFRYVTDDLALEQAQALEAHVRECVHCHGRLREQAELEVFCNDLSEKLEPPGAPEKAIGEPRHFGSSWKLFPVAVALFYLGPGSVGLPPPRPVAQASSPARPVAYHPPVALVDQKFMKFTGAPPALTAGRFPAPNDAGRDAGHCIPPCSRAPLC